MNTNGKLARMIWAVDRSLFEILQKGVRQAIHVSEVISIEG